MPNVQFPTSSAQKVANIAPGWSFQLDLWGVALAAAPAFEFELGYVERVAGQ